MVLEAGNLEIKVSAEPVSVEKSLLIAFSLGFYWQREREEISSLQPALIRVQITFMRAPPSRPNYFLKAPPSTIITLGDRASVYTFWWVGHRYLIHNTEPSYIYYT